MASACSSKRCLRLGADGTPSMPSAVMKKVSLRLFTTAAHRSFRHEADAPPDDSSAPAMPWRSGILRVPVEGPSSQARADERQARVRGRRFGRHFYDPKRRIPSPAEVMLGMLLDLRIPCRPCAISGGRSKSLKQVSTLSNRAPMNLHRALHIFSRR